MVGFGNLLIKYKIVTLCNVIYHWKTGNITAIFTYRIDPDIADASNPQLCPGIVSVIVLTTSSLLKLPEPTHR